MRISDWSSDVCSSDLCSDQRTGCYGRAATVSLEPCIFNDTRFINLDLQLYDVAQRRSAHHARADMGIGFIESAHVARIFVVIQYLGALISEERRVGKECVSRGRTRWGPSHE